MIEKFVFFNKWLQEVIIPLNEHLGVFLNVKKRIFWSKTFLYIVLFYQIMTLFKLLKISMFSF